MTERIATLVHGSRPPTEFILIEKRHAPTSARRKAFQGSSTWRTEHTADIAILEVVRGSRRPNAISDRFPQVLRIVKLWREVPVRAPGYVETRKTALVLIEMLTNGTSGSRLSADLILVGQRDLEEMVKTVVENMTPLLGARIIEAIAQTLRDDLPAACTRVVQGKMPAPPPSQS